MSLLDNLKKKLKKGKKQPSLKRLLRKQTGAASRNIYVQDKYIDPITDEDFDEFLESDKSNELIWKPELFDCPIDEETAWGLGLFFADGSCGFKKAQRYGGSWWKISNSNLYYLERAQYAFKMEWDNFIFHIKSYPSEKKGVKTNLGMRRQNLLSLVFALTNRKRLYGERGVFIEKWRHTFYDIFGQKKVPAALWSATRKVKLAFLEGVVAGDGTKKQKVITVHGLAGLAGLMDCILDVGWSFNIRSELRSKDIHYIYYGRKHEFKPFIADYIFEKQKVSLNALKKEFGRHDYYVLLKELEEDGYIKISYLSENNMQNKQIESIKKYPCGCDDISRLFWNNAKEWFRKKGINASVGWIWAPLPEGNHAFIFYTRKPDFKCIFFKPQIHERFFLHSRPSLMIV